MRWARVVVGALLLLLADDSQGAACYVIVGGLGGEERYTREFEATVASLARSMSGRASDPGCAIVLSGAEAQRSAVLAALRGLERTLGRDDELIVFLVGHGTYDGVDYKLNLPGPDLTARALAGRLDAIPSGAQLVVNATSASGASLEPLMGARRQVVAATRSGGERNATVFGRFFANALTDPTTDLDRDGWITAAEAFEVTQAAVEAFYAREVRLATEHARSEGGEGRSFRLVRLAPPPGAAPGSEQRAALLGAIDSLRDRKDQLPRDAYYRSLEELLVELARMDLGSSGPQSEGLPAPGDRPRARPRSGDEAGGSSVAE